MVTDWTPSSDQTGFSNTVHGGLIATVLDEIMAWTCGVIGGRFAYSVDLQIHYTRPLAPGDQVKGIGTIMENRKRKIFLTSATLKVGGEEIAAATGKYLAVRPSVEETLWSEFGEAASQLKSLRETT